MKKREQGRKSSQKKENRSELAESSPLGRHGAEAVSAPHQIEAAGRAIDVKQSEMKGRYCKPGALPAGPAELPPVRQQETLAKRAVRASRGKSIRR